VNDLATFEVLERGPIVRAALVGELDLSNAADLESLVVDVVPNDSAGMVLDLTRLTYIDSAGIRLLLTLVGRFKWRGQRLALLAPDGCRARRVIELAGAQDALVVDGDDAAAVARVEETPPTE
jgi:anti-anti-sigma factor